MSYWRDKRGHEVDFVHTDRRSEPLAIECKWSVSEFDPTNIKAFRRQYPKGKNLVVASDVEKPYMHTYNDIQVRFVKLEDLIELLVMS